MQGVQDDKVEQKVEISFTSLTAMVNDSQLQTLHLSSVQLHKYMKMGLEFSSLSCVEEMDLSRNWLSHIPPSIGKLRCLKKLNLSNNRLESLPFAMKHCKKLEYLSLEHNRLSFLPGLLLQMNSLTDLRRHGNLFQRSESLLANARHMHYIRHQSVDSRQGQCSVLNASQEKVLSLKQMAVTIALGLVADCDYWNCSALPIMIVRQLDRAQCQHVFCDWCHSAVPITRIRGAYLQWLQEEFLGLKSLPFQYFACSEDCFEELTLNIYPQQQRVEQEVMHFHVLDLPSLQTQRVTCCSVQ